MQCCIRRPQRGPGRHQRSHFSLPPSHIGLTQHSRGCSKATDGWRPGRHLHQNRTRRLSESRKECQHLNVGEHGKRLRARRAEAEVSARKIYTFCARVGQTARLSERRCRRACSGPPLIASGYQQPDLIGRLRAQSARGFGPPACRKFCRVQAAPRRGGRRKARLYGHDSAPVRVVAMTASDTHDHNRRRRGGHGQ